MGRLVKAFPKDDSGENPPSDEAQIQRETGEAVGRIHQEMRTRDAGQRVENPSVASRATGARETPIPDSTEPAMSNQGPRHLGRDVSSEPIQEQAPSDEASSFPAAGSSEGLRLYTGPNEAQPVQNEPQRVLSNSELIQKELMDELIQERNRWTERHAMQVRSIEEQAQQMAQVDAEIERREQELDRRERELDAWARELATQAGATDGQQKSHDDNSIKSEMNRLASEVRVHADRASRFEAELAEARREHATEIDALRRQLSQQDDSREDRAKPAVDEWDQRMAELTEQRTAWYAEQVRRREELARERLELRDELRQQHETQQVELKAAREDFENERDSVIAQLDQERREWKEKFNNEQDELLDLKRATENELTRIRSEIAQDKMEWESRQEQMRIAHREEQNYHQQMLASTRREIAEHSDREQKTIAAEMAELERLKDEQATRIETLQKELEAERVAWHRQRGQEAAILQTERSEVETEAERLREERSLIEEERQQLAAELEKQRAEHDERLRQSWRSHQTSIQESEQEVSSRQRVLTENLQQQEAELAARMKQAEQEIRIARELSSRQIAQKKEQFSQTCAAHEAELNRTRAELNVQRQQFEREKLEFADETARVQEQAEQQRNVIRNSLSQMDAQLRLAANSLLSGASAESVAAGFVERLQPSVEAIESTMSEDESSQGDAVKPVAESLTANSKSVLATRTSGAVDSTIDEAESTEVEIAGDGQDLVDVNAFGQDKEPVDGNTDSIRKATVWEPGKEATLVESRSSELIRRVDMPSESGGVSGLEIGPRIASHGVIAQARAEATSAEVVHDSRDEEPEWAGTVGNSIEDVATNSNTELDGDGRRQALENYRSKLTSLQEQLRQLSHQTTDGSTDDESGSA